MAERIPARLTPAEGRRFAFTVGAAFLVLAGIAWWRGHPTARAVLASIGGVLLAGGVVVPGRLGPVYRGWMGFAHLISKVTTPIFMGIVYFLVLAPVGLVMQLLGRNPMVHAEGDGGFWARHGARKDPRQAMKRQF